MILKLCDIVRCIRTGKRGVLYNIVKSGHSGEDEYQIVFPDGTSNVYWLSQIRLVKPAIE